jgi:NAD(P)-dependent dehydrogenase (short-subunit alcohol dehydrogenase family)
MSFDGKVAVVTGGARGLGSAFASAVAGEGARVVLLDADEAVVTDTAGALEQRGFAALGAACDVRDEHDVERAVQQALDRFGRIDILVNSAALHRHKYNQPFGSMARDDVRDMFDVNVMGILNCALACRPPMASTDGGVIVNLASTAGHTSCTPYGVSKLAARGLTVALAYEFAGDNIRVNAISPGFVGSAGTLADYAPEQLMALLASQGVRLPETVLAKCSTQDLVDIFMSLQLTEREGTPDDVVKALLYLCSDDAAFVTGETLMVAGGAALAF